MSYTGKRVDRDYIDAALGEICLNGNAIVDEEIMKTMKMYRYEIYQANLPSIPGSHIRSGCRPVVIVSNDMANAYSPVVTVVPLTTRLGKKCLPTHVTLLTSGLRTVSLALCEQLMALDKSRMTHYIGYVTDPDDQAALERAVAIQLGLVA